MHCLYHRGQQSGGEDKAYKWKIKITMKRSIWHAFNDWIFKSQKTLQARK
jgi:hypothetical protein